MGVNNVQNLNKAELYKLAKQKQGQQPKVDQQSWMSSTGSIFNAPNAKNTSTTKGTTQTQTNTPTQNPNSRGEVPENKDNLYQLYSGRQTRSGSAKSASGNEEDPYAKYKNVDNAGDGKALANDGDKIANDLDKQNQEIEREGKNSEKVSKDANKTAKDLTKENKTFQKQLKQEQKTFLKAQQDIEAAAEEMEAAQVKIDAINAEIESLQSASSGGLQSSNVFSLKLAGETQQTQNGTMTSSSSDDTSAKIASLQSQAASYGQIMISNGKIIQTKQSVSTKSLKNMNTMTRTMNKNTTKIQKQLETQANEQSKVIKVADKIDKIAQTVSQVGQALKLGGQALVALGAATSWCGVGAALISAGSFMQKVGNVVELVGNYGQMAANITKTAAYAAEGNLAGALSSAGTALMTGAAAVKGTKEFSSNMEAINQKAEQATQKLAANSAAKEITKNADIPEGMSKSAFKKDVKAQILEDGISGDSAKDMKSKIMEKSSTYTENTKTAFANEQRWSSTALNEVNPNWSDKKVAKKAKKLANKQIKNNANARIADVNSQWASSIPKSKSSKLFEDAKKLGTTLSAAGAQMQQFDNMSSGSSSTGYVGHRLTNPAKTKQVIASINKRRYAGAMI